jgi:hypothetical protein
MLDIRQKFEKARASQTRYEDNQEPDWRQSLEDVGELESVRALGVVI